MAEVGLLGYLVDRATSGRRRDEAMATLRRLAAQEELTRLQGQGRALGLPSEVPTDGGLLQSLPLGGAKGFGEAEQAERAAAIQSLGIRPDVYEAARSERQAMEMRRQALEGLGEPTQRANFANRLNVAPPYTAGSWGVVDRYTGAPQWSPKTEAEAGRANAQTTTEGARQGLIGAQTATEGFQQGLYADQGAAAAALAQKRRLQEVGIRDRKTGALRSGVVRLNLDGSYEEVPGLGALGDPGRQFKLEESPEQFKRNVYRDTLQQDYSEAKAQERAEAARQWAYPNAPPVSAPAPAVAPVPGPAPAPTSAVPGPGAANYQVGQPIQTPNGTFIVIGFYPDGEPAVVPATQ